MENIIRNIGRKFIATALFHHGYFAFSNKVLKTFLKMKFFNPAVFMITVRQIYFTGVQILPVYIIVSLVMGVALVGALSQAVDALGGIDQLGRFMVVLTMKELAPLVTALFIALRSSSAVTAEISLMNINREIASLKSLSIDPYEYLYLPRILAGIISMMALSTIFVCVSVIGGYFILSFLQDLSLDYMLTTIFDNFELFDILAFLIKTTFLGFALMSIPIYTALDTKEAVTEIPIALTRGMMRIFYSFIIIEIFTVLLGVYLL
jgi:phospholipid/cholesterol/gamma-HCH transport system permease protein